jgi:ABC-2 type transport system ATP-binding protein
MRYHGSRPVHTPATTLSHVLQVTGLHASRSGKPILNDVSLSARPGEVLGLIGPNGSGKTTLFECIAGLLPSTGQIDVFDSGTAAALRKQKLFYVPDSIRPWPGQSVSWILELQRSIFSDPRVHGEDLLARLDLSDLRHHRIGTLSKGEAKRLTILLGLTSPQPILLLDEPFDGLDLRQTHRAMDLLREVAASGRTLFLSIHQLNDAARMCDRFVLLSHGRIVGEGTLEQLSARAGVKSGGLEEVFLALT